MSYGPLSLPERVIFTISPLLNPRYCTIGSLSKIRGSWDSFTWRVRSSFSASCDVKTQWGGTVVWRAGLNVKEVYSNNCIFSSSLPVCTSNRPLISCTSRRTAGLTLALMIIIDEADLRSARSRNYWAYLMLSAGKAEKNTINMLFSILPLLLLFVLIWLFSSSLLVVMQVNRIALRNAIHSPAATRCSTSLRSASSSLSFALCYSCCYCYYYYYCNSLFLYLLLLFLILVCLCVH